MNSAPCWQNLQDNGAARCCCTVTP
jgi:hypothetical protein